MAEVRRGRGIVLTPLILKIQHGYVIDYTYRVALPGRAATNQLGGWATGIYTGTLAEIDSRKTQ